MTQSLLALLLACDHGATEASFRRDWMELMTAHEADVEGATTWTLGLTGSLDEPFLVIGGHSVEEDGTGHEFPLWRGELQ